MSELKCDYMGCSTTARWKVICIMGMAPEYTQLNLCDEHNDAPITVVSKKRILTPKETHECSNCKHAHPSLLGWIFCREPIRMSMFLGSYNKGQIPEGGFPHSLNHTCSKWRFSGVKQTLNFPITYGFKGPKKSKPEHANEYYLWRLFNKVMKKLGVK